MARASILINVDNKSNRERRESPSQSHEAIGETQ